MRYASINDLPQQHRAEAERQLGRQAATSTFMVTIQGAKPHSVTMNVEGKPVVMQEVLPPPKKPSKYHNVRVLLDGEWYDSRKEYEFHQLLKAREKAGEIGHILRQVTYRLEGDVRYRADFVCSLPNAPPPAVEAWDVKGYDTRSSINKRKQVRARYGIEVMLWPPREPKGTP